MAYLVLETRIIGRMIERGMARSAIINERPREAARQTCPIAYPIIKFYIDYGQYPSQVIIYVRKYAIRYTCACVELAAGKFPYHVCRQVFYRTDLRGHLIDDSNRLSVCNGACSDACNGACNGTCSGICISAFFLYTDFNVIRVTGTTLVHISSIYDI
jgi:hypothetical protein